MRLAEDGTVVGVFANCCEALGVQKEKSRLCCGASSLPDTCTPWPDPNPAGGKCSLSTDLTGEIFHPPLVLQEGKDWGMRLDTQKDLRKNVCPWLWQNAMNLCLKA